MTETLRLYLDTPTLGRVARGDHNFFARLIAAVQGAGWQVEVLESTLAHRLAAPAHGGYALYHMEAPTHSRALTCRRCYVGAFWNIEASAQRWDWPVAEAAFDPETVDGAAAGAFFAQWQRWLFPGGTDAGDDGFDFVPLQGRLLAHRGFQSMSPVAMLETLLQRGERPVVATLHPGETYGDDEMLALGALVERFPHLTVDRGISETALARCHRVVSENSAMVLRGYFLRKPALLFAKADFHHIAASVPRDGLDAALTARPAPDFARYLYWFLQLRAINAGRPECEAQIRAALRRHGWPI